MILLVLVSVFVVGCASVEINDIKGDSDSWIGEEVRLKGTVSNTIKIGQLSGFTLNQDNSKINVQSDTLPEEGSEVIVKGVVMKDSLFGPYILAKEVR